MPAAVRLVSYNRFEDFQEGALSEWVDQVGKTAWAQSKPTVIVSPDTPRSGFIREQIARFSDGLLGVAFWNPGQLRRYLFEKQFPDQAIATQEDLVLLIRAVIEEAEDRLLWKPLGDDPKRFLSAWDTMIAAHADEDLILPEWRLLVKAFEAKLKSARLSSVQQADWALQAVGAEEALRLGHLVIWGISPTHAHLYPLLQAAANTAESVLWGLPLNDQETGVLWQGSLEQRYGSAEPLVSLAEEPFRSLVEGAEYGGATEVLEEGRVEVALAGSRFDEISGIVDAAERAYTTTENPRIGIVLPTKTSLSREVVRRLIEQQLPTHDAFGHFPIAPDQQRLFNAWLAYQSQPVTETAHLLIRDLEALRYIEESTVERVEQAWKEARMSTLNDHLEILQAWMQLNQDAKNQAALKWSQEWPLLPEKASLTSYLEAVGQPLERFGLKHALEALRSEWVGRADVIPWLSREIFVQWLGESLSVPGKHRDPQARDVFSPIQVISYEQVGGQSWTHLILGGLNEGLVPTVIRENPFIHLDASERHLKKHRKVGNQGEGHFTLDDNVGFLLDEREQRSLYWHTLLGAIEQTKECIRISATLSHQVGSRDAAVLSEYFLRIIRALPKEWDIPPLEPSGEDSTDSVEKTVASTKSSPSPLPSPQQTADAYRARWNAEKPFDEYTFCLKSPKEPLELTARQWESLIKHPAAVWLTAIAGVEKVERFNELPSIPLSKGILIHRLLSQGTSGQFEVFRTPQEWVNQAVDASLEFTQHLKSTYQAGGKPISDRLMEQTAMIRRSVKILVQAVADCPFIGETARELSIPSGSIIRTKSGPLHLRGRPDLLLKEKSGAPLDRWVIDFKTGGDKPLTLKRVEAGENLQLILYARFFADVWNHPVAVCLLSPGIEIEAQFRVEPNADETPWFDLLAEIGQRGQLGYAGDSNQEYGYTPEYPMALIKLPAGVWKRRRLLTYPMWPEKK